METENLEDIKEALREYRKAYWEKYKEKYKNDPEYRQRRIEYQRRYAQEHKAERNAYIKEWRKLNPDKVRLYAAHTAINWFNKQKALKAQEAQNEQDNADR